MATNPYVNKVALNGTTLLDLTGDTAVASDVAQGKTFHLATGERVTGTASGGQSITVSPLSVTANGTYTAPAGEAYSPVTVDTEADPPNDGKTHLFISVPVDGDDYKFVITSAKNDITIDWGDGTIEQNQSATLSHSYINSGEYEVVFKCSTALSASSTTFGTSNLATNAQAKYVSMLIRAYFYDPNLELNTFRYCPCIKKFDVPLMTTTIASNFDSCYSLKEIRLGNITSILSYCFRYCFQLGKITIPATVASIGNSAFTYCRSLREVHMLSTTPPTLGTNVFSNVSSNLVIYVPSASLEAYQTAENWSNYASKMVGV